MPSEGTIFPAFVRLQHLPDDSGKAGFLRAVEDVVSSGNQRLGELGKGLDPLRRYSEEARRQLEALNRSLSSGAGPDIGTSAAREAAAAADARAAAARELAQATELAARAAGDETEQARLAVVAARAQALEEEAAARAARSHAEALTQLQAQLDRTATESGKAAAAAGRNVAANDNAAGAAARQRAGLQQLSFQIGDVAASFASGTSPMQIFGQQAGQVTQAIGLMSGEAKGLVGFIGGPWGQVLIAGATILGTVAAAHYGAADAAKDHKDAAEDLTKAIGDLREATLREARSTQASIQADIDKANGLRQRAQEARKAALAELQLAQSRAGSAGASIALGAPSYSNTYNLGEQGKQEAIARDAQATIARLNAEITASEETVRLKRGALIRQGVTEELDKGAAATGRYERALDRLNGQLQAGSISEAQYRAAVLKAAQARDAATESATRSTNAHRTNTVAARAAARAADEEAKARQRLVFENDKALEAMNKAKSDAFRAADAGAWDKLLGNLSTGREAFVAPFRAAAAETAQWNAELEQVLGSLQQIGGFAGTLGGLLGALGGKPGALGGPAGLLLGTLRNAQWSTIDSQGNRTIFKLGEELDRAFGSNGLLAKTLEGAAIGSAGASLVLGSRGNNPGAAIGGALGDKLGEKVLGPALEKGFGKIFGALGGPLGGIIGGIAGGLIGGLFGKWKSGAAVITQSGVAVSGNSAERKNALSGLGDTLQSSLDKIAGQLGADLGRYSVSIGLGKENYRVSASGSASVGDKKYPKNAGADLLYDGKDATEALRIALADAIRDGAIIGVRASTQALLKAGKDVEGQLQKALDFESVFRRLKGYTDPVGSAIDGVNVEFKRLGKIFEEAGASAAEYADLEKLYGLERAKAVKAATDQIAGSLRDLYESLTIGNDALSLSDRKAAALAAYQPLETRVKAGDAAAYDDYTKAAQTLLDIERQMSGSQSDYFALLDQVTTLSKSRLDAETAKIAAASSSDSPFTKADAGATTTADGSAITGAIGQLQSALLEQFGLLNSNTVGIIKQLIATNQAAGKFSPAYGQFFAAGNW